MTALGWRLITFPWNLDKGMRLLFGKLERRKDM